MATTFTTDQLNQLKGKYGNDTTALTKQLDTLKMSTADKNNILNQYNSFLKPATTSTTSSSIVPPVKLPDPIKVNSTSSTSSITPTTTPKTTTQQPRVTLTPEETASYKTKYGSAKAWLDSPEAKKYSPVNQSRIMAQVFGNYK